MKPIKTIRTLLTVLFFSTILNAFGTVPPFTHNYAGGVTYYRITGNTSFTTDVVIEKDAYVIFECGIFTMAPGKKILVKLGCQLFITNAIVTQSADASTGHSTSLSTANNWLGIQVEGDLTKDQRDIVHEALPPCYQENCAIGDVHGPINQDLARYKQGFLSMYKSTIRYSDYGVCMGGFFAYPIANGPNFAQGGGIFTATQCSFENNYYHHLYFDQYGKQQNVAKIMNNTFLYNHLNSTTATFSFNHTDVVAFNSSFMYNIQQNKFIVLTPFNNFNGFWLNSAYMRLYENTFQNHMAGAILNSKANGLEFFKNFYIVQENTFDKCQMGLDIQTPNVRVYGNTFNLCPFTRYINGGPSFMSYFSSSYAQLNLAGFTSPQNATVGIYNGRAVFNTQCKYNKFVGSVQLSKQDAAIVSWDASKVGSLVFQNTFSGVPTGFRSIGDNRGFQLYCNTFSNSKINDILNETTSRMSNQGSGTYAVRNQHTRYFGFLGFTRYDIYNQNSSVYSGANRLKYFYRTGIPPETPAHISGTTVNLSTVSSSTNSCLAKADVLSYAPAIACTKLNRIPTEITYYNDIKSDINDIEIGGISPSEQDEYDRLMHDFDITMADVMDAYISNGMEYGYDETDSIRRLLLAHNTLNSKLYLVPLYLSIDSFTVAENLMDSLIVQYPSDTFVADYVEYYTLMDSYSQSGSSQSWLFSHHDDFINIVNANGYMSEYAFRLVQDIEFNDTTHTYSDSMPLYRYLPTIDETELTDTIRDSILGYPVPFTSSLSIDIHNYTPNSRTYNIILLDLSETQMFNSNLTVFPRHN